MDRRVARTKKNIYRAFFRLVQTKAIDDITVSELARAADIDRKTFYLHYQTVRDVFVEFKQMIYDSLLEILSEAERRGNENARRLEAGEVLERQNDVAPFDFIFFY
ncbi:MAG: TetR family transcriptional regulator, partial [Clostridia bacterium]|nr:TetR family transcriptional regulator [Clostridia bacterium]